MDAIESFAVSSLLGAMLMVSDGCEQWPWKGRQMVVQSLLSSSSNQTDVYPASIFRKKMLELGVGNEHSPCNFWGNIYYSKHPQRELSKKKSDKTTGFFQSKWMWRVLVTPLKTNSIIWRNQTTKEWDKSLVISKQWSFWVRLPSRKR